ncbi:MAG TPA: RNA polymerase sigma factor [Streptosporangiaceae bacterium]|nr:RNA polymerase sigma factor [Streptosporangiaceae bacterium]
MSETTAHPARQPLHPPGSRGQPPGNDATAEFGRLYRAHVEAVTAFFARRSADPQTVADLTADTFVQVITSFGAFDPRKGTARAWVFGIAWRVYAAHCEAHSQQRDKVMRLAGRRELDPDQVGELLDRIDAERAGRALVTGLTALPAPDRALIELVDIAGFRVKEAAGVLGVAPGAARMRLMRARARLREAAGRTVTDRTRGEGND